MRGRIKREQRGVGLKRQNMNFKEKFILRGPPDAMTGLPAAMSDVSVIVENELCKGAHIPLA